MSSSVVPAGLPSLRDTALVSSGASAPLGATVSAEGVGFSVFAKDATRIDLLLFDDRNACEPARVVSLDAPRHRTYHYWHVFVPGLAAGQLYGYRAHGPFTPQRGLRFDAEKLLLDPYGLAVAVPDAYSRHAARRPGDTTASAMKSVVADPGSYDCQAVERVCKPQSWTDGRKEDDRHEHEGIR